MGNFPRAGRPHTLRGTIADNDGIQASTVIDGETPTTWISVENLGNGAGIKVYFSEADWTADKGFVTVRAGTFRDFPVELYGNLKLLLRAEGPGDGSGSADYLVLYAQRVV